MVLLEVLSSLLLESRLRLGAFSSSKASVLRRRSAVQETYNGLSSYASGIARGSKQAVEERMY